MDKDIPPLRIRLAALKQMPPFLRLAWETHRGYVAAIVLLRVVQSFGPVALLWIGKLVVDTVVANLHASAPAWNKLATLIAAELALALSLDALRRTSSLLESLLADLFANRMSVRLMKHASTLDLAHFEDPGFYDHLERARRQAVGRLAPITRLVGVGQSALTLATLLAALLAFNPWLLLMLLVAVLPSFVGETHYAALSYSLLFDWTPARRELDYLRYVASSDRTAKEVKVFGLSEFFIERYKALADALYAANSRLSLRRAVVGAGLTALSTTAYYGAYGFIVWRTVVGALTVGSLTFLAGSFNRSRELISNILLGLADLYEQSLSLADLFFFFDMRPRISRPKRAHSLPNPIRRGFKFEDVGFRYPDAANWALRHVHLSLAPGERIALVGENGAGKTTLVKLFARLYEPSEGRILLDGVDLREYDLEELHEAIGIIFQDYVRYDLTARENIAVGRIEAIANWPAIKNSAEKSLAASVVAHLEKGYDHMLGRRFEGGADLSGGEWQKIALARAYMRNAQVLFLDEPTASLDARAEYEVFRRISELMTGRMTVLISHRFSTVRMADRILVFEGGQVTEDGSHEMLLKRRGTYAKLFSLQAAGYR